MILDLAIIDVYGHPIKESVFVHLQRRGSAQTKQAQVGGGPVSIDLENDVYRLFIDPPSYLPIQVFTQPGPLTLTAVIDPLRVTRFERPYFDKMMLVDAEVYRQLDPLRCAGLLNIITKCRATAVPSGRVVWDFIDSVLEIRQDRLFVSTYRTLYEELRSSTIFADAPSGLHHPPAGFVHAGSFKSDDAYGNLQVTFFTNDDGEWQADLDIDDAAGLGHVFQVLRNTLTGRPTHPYDIHQILFQHQHLDTGYRLHVA